MTRNGCRRVAEVRVIEVVGKGVAGSEVDGLEEVESGKETSGASHNQADAAFFRFFPPFSFYKIEFYLE